MALEKRAPKCTQGHAHTWGGGAGGEGQAAFMLTMRPLGAHSP